MWADPSKSLHCSKVLRMIAGLACKKPMSLRRMRWYCLMVDICLLRLVILRKSLLQHELWDAVYPEPLKIMHTLSNVMLLGLHTARFLRLSNSNIAYFGFFTKANSWLLGYCPYKSTTFTHMIPFNIQTTIRTCFFGFIWILANDRYQKLQVPKSRKTHFGDNKSSKHKLDHGPVTAEIDRQVWYRSEPAF